MNEITSQSGAEILLRALRDQGVEVIFGYPGGAVLPIYDAIFQQNSIRHILVRHEQAAVHAAEGYARSTGKVGVVLVTSGPGATNAVTGLVDALMDSIPLVCLTGQYTKQQATWFRNRRIVDPADLHTIHARYTGLAQFSQSFGSALWSFINNPVDATAGECHQPGQGAAP